MVISFHLFVMILLLLCHFVHMLKIVENNEPSDTAYLSAAAGFVFMDAVSTFTDQRYNI